MNSRLWALVTTQRYRNLAAIIASLALMQAALGVLSVAGILALSASGAANASLGVVVGAYALGFLLGARFSVTIIAAIGHIRCFASCAAIAATLSLLLYVRIDPAYWTFVQAALGVCVAGLLATGESWVTDAAPYDRRGAVLGFYLVASKLGTVSGSLIAALAQPSVAGGFMIAGAFMALSLVPVAATRSLQPRTPDAAPFGLLRLWSEAPAAVVAAFIAGMVNGSVLQLYAVFAARFQPEATLTAAATFNLAMIAGSLLIQWPVGRMSDRMDRRGVIAILAATGAGAACLLALIPHNMPFAFVLCLAAIWGAGALSFYGIAVAHAADRATAGQTTSMMCGILMVWGMGAIVGPLIAGALMELPIGTRGLFAMAAGALLILALMMLRRRAVIPPPAQDEKFPFAPALATSVAIVQLDSRADDGQQDLFSLNPSENRSESRSA